MESLFIRENDSISSNHSIRRELTLPHPVSCYHHVLAFDIENDSNISEFAINGNLTIQVDVECFQSKIQYTVNDSFSQSDQTCKQTGTASESSHGVVAAAVVSVLTVTVISILSIMFIILWFRIKSKSLLAIAINNRFPQHLSCIYCAHTEKDSSKGNQDIIIWYIHSLCYFYAHAHTSIIQQHFKEYVIHV